MIAIVNSLVLVLKYVCLWGETQRLQEREKL